MSGKNTPALPRVFLRALAAWAVCAAALLLCASALFAAGVGDMSSMGYISSLISFISAICAGICIKAVRGRGVWKGALFGAALCALLLLTGFIAGGGLDGSAALSAASFTLAGSLVGSVLPAGQGRGKKRAGTGRSFHKRRP